MRMSARRANCMGKGGPIGRRLDFLAQEFSREANTLCAKANDVSLTVMASISRPRWSSSASRSRTSSEAMTANLENETISRRGLMLVLSSPSGAGKTTLTRLLREQESSLTLSVSVTTRPRRASEIEGIHYRFITPQDFGDMRDRGELLEWAEVHGNFYGSPRREIDRSLAAGQDILFDIDYQGAQQIRANAAADVVSVFILPPSIPEMKRRLERRAEDPPEMIARRMRTALGELERWREYDYVLVNDDLARCFERLQAILVAERLRRERQPGLEMFVDGLMSDLRQLTS